MDRSALHMLKCAISFMLFAISLLLPAQKKEISIPGPSKARNTSPYFYLDSAVYYLKNDPRRSFEFVEEALTTSIENKNQVTEGLSYQTLGLINEEIKQNDIAQNYYDKAVHIFTLVNDQKNLNETYVHYARSLININDTPKGIEYLNKALKYYESTSNNSKASAVKQMLADAYAKTGQNKKALGYLDDALAHEKSVENIAGVVELQQKIGDVYLEENKNEEAIQNYNSSVQSARASNDQELISSSLTRQSKAFRKTKMYGEELRAREELNKINESRANLPGMARNKIEIADIYMEMDNPEKAEENILESIKITEKTGDIESKGIAYKKLSGVYGKNKEYNKALEAYKSYVATVDKVHAKQKEEIQSNIELYASLNRKLQRLDMLEQDLELNRKSMSLLMHEQELNKKELVVQKRVTYTLLIIIFALTLATYLIYRSSLNKRKANQLLALKSLRSQMNPHFIYNSLNSINNFIAKNDERSANKYLSSFSRLMRSVMDNSKDDFVALSSELNILKLYLELENSRFPDKFDYTMEIAENIDLDHFMVPPMLIQPFLENAIWHGLRYKKDKGYLKLSVFKINKFLEIIIEDNGIGRQKSREIKTRYQKEHKSSGLKNIDSRLNIIRNVFHLNITVEIEDLDKENLNGTLVKINIPERITEKEA